jgi:hypothetical protein
MVKAQTSPRSNIFSILAWFSVILWIVYYFGPREEAFPLSDIVLVASPIVGEFCSYLAIKKGKTTRNMVALIINLGMLLFTLFAFYFSNFIFR